MGKFKYKDGTNHSKPTTPENDYVLESKAEYKPIQPIESRETIANNEELFSSMVTRQYLHALSECNVKPMSTSLELSPVRWYKIDRVVKEKDVFFTDRLSMLYMALHKSAKNVALVVNKQNDGDIELYIGARDFTGRDNISGETLKAALMGFFPGMKIERASKIKNVSEIFDRACISSVSAVASLRDDKKEDFVQGLERLINATANIPQFRAYFIADSVEKEEADAMLVSFNRLYSDLSPMESQQITYSENESKGVSESITKNFSKTVGENISQTVTNSEGVSKTTTIGHSDTKSDSNNESKSSGWNIIIRSFGNKSKGTSHTESKTNSNSETEGNSKTHSESNQTGSSNSETKGTSEQNGTNKTDSKGLSCQVSCKDRTVKCYLDILDKHIERIQGGQPFGLWSVATYFVANDSTTAKQLANIYRGTIIGEESELTTCAINSWKHENPNSKEIINYISKSLNPCFDYNGLTITPGTIVTSKELAIHLSFPQSSVPGVIVDERASFARNVLIDTKEDKDAEKIEIGKVLYLGNEEDSPVSLSISEMTKHTFITGTTGSGKSNTLYLILDSLLNKGKKFLVIEPAKGEYKNVFGNRKDVSVYSNTHKIGELLRINPFCFPYEKIDVLEHIDRLVEIFNACWPMYAAMPAVLKHSILTAYEKCGWDTSTSTHKLENPIFPTIKDVVSCLKYYIENSAYSADTKGDYIGALQVRLQELCEGMFSKMLNADSLSDEELFNRNVIVDLSRIGSTETKSLIMGFLVMKLNEFRMAEGGMNREFRHVTVLEEAHNLLKRTSTDQSQESSNLAGKSVEMLSNSIAEMRTYGEAFIIADQSPALLDAAVIRNTNTKIILALPESEDRKVAGLSISLTEEQIDEIAKQKTGEAIIYQNSWEKPVQCKVARYEYDENYCFDKSSVPAAPKAHEPNLDVVRFLLKPYIKQDFNIGVVRKSIEADTLLSSTRFGLLELISEYEKTKKINIWNEVKFSRLAQIVKDYLDIEENHLKLFAESDNADDYRQRFDDLLENIFHQKLSREDLYYIQKCYVLSLKKYDEWRSTFE